ncbi:MAG: bifunctional glutathionylspermidine amidase/synthase [Alphaproteobacteria bacterium]|nr:bifunctional glutathionylspermidine amidase/synthase [Alphaproteobacteria bacterium]
MRHHHTPQSAPFGTLLGTSADGVEVYSSDYDSVDKSQLPNRQAYRSTIGGVFMGYKWQCVELARRWMYLNKGYIFEDIAMAYDIFRLKSVKMIEDGSELPLHSFRNGSRRPPEPGSLLIWNEGGYFEVTGHVAVVTEVLVDTVRCIEQNVDDKVWAEGTDYSRELAMDVDANGRHWVKCTYADTSVLGWVIETADATHADDVDDPDPHLFNLIGCEVENRGQADTAWLDTSKADAAAYVDMMGGHKLTSADADAYRYFCISQTASMEIKRATNELHAMFMHATNFVLQDDQLLAKFNLPQVLWPRIHQSWDNRRNEMITGRFDFSVSQRGIKVYEYNCDSASCHMECGNVQEVWAEHFGCSVGTGSGIELTKDLIAAWKDIGLTDTLHIMHDRDKEEIYHALYMKSAIEAAGIRTKRIKGVSGLAWDDEGCVVDSDGERINFVWKTWAWESALDQIREEITEDERAEGQVLRARFERVKKPPRLVDVLLRRDVMVFEPLWTLIPSNKAILPVLWMLYPDHPYLLETQFSLTDNLRRKGYAAKPIVGRCGANISIFNADNELVSETHGQFDSQDQIFQEYFPLPKIGGMNVQIGTFTAAGTLAGTCVRVDPSPVITTHSDMLALRIVPDQAMASLKSE